MAEIDNRLKFLNEAQDDSIDAPRVKGWDVVNAFEKPIGKVHDLLIDSKEEAIRYVDVELKDDVVNKENEMFKNPNADALEGNMHMLIPVGTVRLDEENRRLVSDEINQNIIERGPLHRQGEEISTEYERSVVSLIKEADTGSPKTIYSQTSGPVNDEFYEGSYFNTERFYNKR